ncbi:hypothetical protein Poli38472_005167 [Pythium oligandrum]|uniref:Major facilitator superfamily (MFS) profile domain-containing protein n=1 Tax=Pythium oligandrum TaxID=41045 RepID=A0A8K1FIY3_PYTOL|nr:hypothetical protein Poli38472_005167 [Pythium oligandrum]|eukprot:TMW62549.1 hypothetical protein Poli38472_005167 [Pythium oligandrum]
MVANAGTPNDVDLESSRALQVRVATNDASAIKHVTKVSLPNDEARRRERVRSWYAHIALISVAEFAAEASRGLVLPTLFSYCEELGGDLVFAGLLASLFSGGRFVSSLLFGWLSDRVSFKTMYHISAIFATLGSVLYILPYSPAIHSKTLLARSLALTSVFSTSPSSRRSTSSRTRSLLDSAASLAISMCKFGIEYFRFNRFTAPGYILIFLNLFTMAMNTYVYDESITRDDAPMSKTGTEREVDKSQAAGPPSNEQQQSTLSDRMVTIGIIVFIFQNFNARGILLVFETVNVPLYLRVTDQNSVGSVEAVSTTTEAATFYFAVGLLGLVSYAAVQLLRKRVSDEGFLPFGFFVLMVGNALLLALCFFMGPINEESTTPEPTKTSFDLFVISEIFVWSIGCPLTSAVVVSAFSNVLGTRPQGALMGLFGSSASISRMIMPFLPGVLPSWTWLFSVNLVLCGISMVVLGLYLRFLKQAFMDTRPAQH